MRYAARVDENQAEIVRDLRQIPGVFVLVLSGAGHGIPDTAVWTPYRNGGCWIFIEIKDGSKCASRRQLTKMQKVLHRKVKHTNTFFVANNIEEARGFVGVDMELDERFRRYQKS